MSEEAGPTDPSDGVTGWSLDQGLSATLGNFQSNVPHGIDSI